MSDLLNNRTFLLSAAGAVVIVCYGWVMNASYHDANLQQSNYCQQVASGAWPNFRHLNCRKLYPHGGAS
jgi:hypothetical protein